MNAADTTDPTNTLKPITAVGEEAQRRKADREKNRNRERKLMVDMDRITPEITQ